MAYCANCKINYDDSVRFCTECGAALEPGTAPEENTSYNPQQSNTAKGAAAGVEQKVTDAFNKFNNTADSTAELDANDIEQNKIMGVLAYLSWLVIIPLFAAKNSKFARFHCNQGIVLAIAELVLSIINTLLNNVLPYGFFYTLVNIIFSVIWAACGIMSIIGLVNALQGKAKELPFIGKYRIIK